MPCSQCWRWLRKQASVSLHTIVQKEEKVQQQFRPRHGSCKHLDFVTDVTSFLRTCASPRFLPRGKCIHSYIILQGRSQERFLGNTLVHMYGKCGALRNAYFVFERIYHPNEFSWNLMIGALVHFGSLHNARLLFDIAPIRDVVSWNALIAAYTHHGCYKEAFHLFQQMKLEGITPNVITCVSILDACACDAALLEGKQIHDHVVFHGFESDVIVGTALVNMYGKCGRLDEAREVFERLPKRDVVLWTAMIEAYAQQGLAQNAFELFEKMQFEDVMPNTITFASLIDACAIQGAFEEGKLVHDYILNCGIGLDITLSTALVNFYGKCGNLEAAEEIFTRMPKHDPVSWAAMLAAYAQCGSSQRVCQISKVMPLHDLVSWNAMIAAYAQCGNMEDARKLFNNMPQRNIVSWNSVIAAYSQHGDAKEALECFHQMHLEDLIPVEITFLSIFSVCSHRGLISEGFHYLTSMSSNYDILFSLKHYVCMIDLLGRAGQLDNAKDWIDHMPFAPTIVSWMALLGACRIFSNEEDGDRIADFLFRLDMDNEAIYHILLSNIYAACGKWDHVQKMRKMMKEKVLKSPHERCKQCNIRLEPKLC